MSTVRLIYVLTLSGLFLLPADAGDVQVVNFCDLIRAPERFAGRTVSVRASVDKTYHWLVLRNANCEGSIMLETRTDVEPKREVPLEKDKEFEKLDNALYQFKPGTMELSNRIEADFQGRFDSVIALKGKRKVRVAKGYGHGFQAKMRLVLVRVTDVSVVPLKSGQSMRLVM